MSMGDTLVVVISVSAAVILMIVFPLMSTADKTDDIAVLSVQTAITEFVNNAKETGKITKTNYDKLVETIISSTGNTYDVELVAQVKDKNAGKKTSQAQADKTGENETYYEYTSQIENILDKKGEYLLTEGSTITARAIITSETIGEQLKNAFLGAADGNNVGSVIAEASGLVTVNGTK